MNSSILQQVTEGFQLSPQQKRAWHLYRAHPQVEFGTQCMVLVHGPLEVHALDKAIAAVRGRYEILRTSFALLDEAAVPVQLVNESTTGLNEVIDRRDTNLSSRSAELGHIGAIQRSRCFGSPECQAFVFTLVVLAQQEHALFLTASSLYADASTLVNLVREIQAEYSGRHDAAQEILQYADLSEWENQLLMDPVSAHHDPYWQAIEFGELSFPRLPFERRFEEKNSQGSEVRGFNTMVRTLPVGATARLNELTSRMGRTLPAILFAAWAIILQRLSGTEKFLIGASLEGRVHQELYEAVGILTKSLPVGVRIEEADTFAALVRQVDTSLQMAHYDHFLFSWRSFGAPSGSDRRYLYPLLFATREQPPVAVTGPLTWEFKDTFERLEPFELMLAVMTGAEGLSCEFSWDTAVFAQRDIELVGDCYLALLSEIAVEPSRRVNEFTMGSVPDDEEILDRTVRNQHEFCPVHELIEKQARRVPQQVALVCDDVRLTYEELEKRAAALANRVEQAGAVSESVVAIVADRSVDFFIGILAVLKAGAAWLPIEPETPAERIDYMVEQAGTAAVLKQPGVAWVPSNTSLPVVQLDEWNDPGITRSTRFHRPVHPRQLAYLIFTSGSTGRPKGVCIEHRQFAAYVDAMASAMDIAGCKNFALVSTVAADLGHTAVFAALTSGGCLHVISAARASDADALADYFAKYSVDFVKIVPSHLEALCRSFPEGISLPWRRLVVGGEQLTWNLVELVGKLAPDCTIMNHYGPTETTIGAVCGVADPKSRAFQESGVPIGCALKSVSVYVLDSQLRPVPFWMVGELYIGGDSVGRGYVGRPDLTAERFVPDPFSLNAGARMYRTGDLVRRRSDGMLEFLGRRDGQIKLRGFRIELGEVEAALCKHPEVHNAVSLVVDHPQRGKQIVTWAAVGNSHVRPDELRRFLEQSLPLYMVPAVLVCVDHLKLTPNGKVDRQALAQAIPPETPVMVHGPVDETEDNLLFVWQKVLGRTGIGVDDNYFSLGGDSLRVIMLVHEARRYGILISANDVLRFQTVRQLRRALRENWRQAAFPDGIPPLPPPSPQVLERVPHAAIVDCYPIAGIQKFVLEKYAQNKGSQGFYHIQESLHIRDHSFSFTLLEKALQVVVDRHPALRTVFDLKSQPSMQWVRQRVQWKLRNQDISHLPAEAQEEHISSALAADRTELFDTEDRESALFRGAVFLRSSTDFELVFSCHHAILDGWGHRVFLNQLIDSYLRLKSGEKPQLGKPDKTYREFVAVQDAVRQWDKAAAFWRNYMLGVKNPVLVPDISPHQAPEKPALFCEFESSLVEALVRTAGQRTVSMQALFLSAWLEVLRDWCSSDLAVTGVIVNGRSEHLTDPLSALGLFWNIVPVVSRTTGPVLESAVALHSDLIEMQPYSAYPLPQLIAEQGGVEPFFSTFRYLRFWNIEQFPQNSGLELVGSQAYDCYSFPLNCTVFLNPALTAGTLVLQYDFSVLSATRVQTALGLYRTLLEKVAAESIA